MTPDSSDTETVREAPTYRELIVRGSREMSWLTWAGVGVFFAFATVVYAGVLIHLHITPVPAIVPNDDVVSTTPEWHYWSALILTATLSGILFNNARKRVRVQAND